MAAIPLDGLVFSFRGVAVVDVEVFTVSRLTMSTKELFEAAAADYIEEQWVKRVDGLHPASVTVFVPTGTGMISDL